MRVALFVLLGLSLTMAGGAGQLPPGGGAGPADVILHGHVVDARDGAALPRARVHAAAGDRAVTPVLTDGDGFFSVAVPAGVASRLNVTKAGFAAAAVRVDAAATAEPVMVTLARGGVITGRVTDSSGVPLTGITVGAQSDGLDSALPPFVTTTDDRGAFRLGALPAGRYAVRELPGVAPGGIDVMPGRSQAAAAASITDAFASPPGNAGATLVVNVRPGEEVATTLVLSRQAPPPLRCAPPAAAAPADSSARAAIRGRVTTSSGEPIACATVWVTAPGTAPRTTTADARGRYAVDGLPGGAYSVEASARGHVPRRYGQRSVSEPGAVIALREGETRDPVDIALSRGGVVTGTVTDEAGEPMSDVVVRALEVRSIEGRTLAGPAGGLAEAAEGWRGERVSRSDDRGVYRLYGLRPGRYLIAASVGADTTGAAAATHGFAPVFHGGTTNAARAPRVVADIDRETIADIIAFEAPTARISGIVTDSAGEPATGSVRLMASQRSGGVMILPGEIVAIDSGGAFVFTNVPYGDYVVHATTAREFGMQYVTAVDPMPPPLTIETSAGATVEGRMTIEGDSGRTAMPAIQALPMDLDQSPERGTGAAVRGGSFRVERLYGPTRFVCCATDRAYLKSAFVNGVDVTDRPFDVGQGDAVYRDAEFVVSLRGGVVSGEVVGIIGRPTNRYAVVALPVDSSLWYFGSRHVKITSIEPRGAFEIAGLPPGHYHVAVMVNRALAAGGDGELRWPDFLHDLVRAARQIAVGEEEHVTVTLRAPGV